MNCETDPDLFEAESGVSDCGNYSQCSGSTSVEVELSNISAGDPRRGNRDPRILLITEAPDAKSKEGAAFEGSTASRIISLFCEDKYGIGMENKSYSTFPEFLNDKRIYATSAIKCYISGTNDIQYLVSECRNCYLNQQISSLNNLELIIPLGKIATASVRRRSVSSVNLTSMVGQFGEGIITDSNYYSAPLVILPHPSGNNPWANPPIIQTDDSRSQRNYKHRFQKSLSFIRQELEEHGYKVLNHPPPIWESSSGFDNYL